jgi:enamine deaminase RidA (YjgF/YER057c/UK114 family)
MTSPHQFLNPDNLAPSPGFSHVAIAAEGTAVYLAGQIAVDERGLVVGATFVEQFGVALGNVVAALDAAKGSPEHVVAMTIYTTAMAEYRSSLLALGPVWRAHMGRHYPAMALLGVASLVEPDALVEIVATAVVPAAR